MHILVCLFKTKTLFVHVCAHSSVCEVLLLLQHTPLVCRDSCALLLARGDQLKPSDSIRGAKLHSEPAELRI